MEWLALKEGDLFLLTDRQGDLSGDYYGLYHQETQFLDRWRLTVNGHPLRPLSGRAADLYRSAILLVNGTDAAAAGVQPLEVEVLRRQVLVEGALHEELRLFNRSLQPHSLTVALAFGTNFSDLFEYRGCTRRQRGRDLPPACGEQCVVLGYEGLDQIRRRTLIRWSDPAGQVELLPGTGTSGAIRWRYDLEPGASRAIGLSVTPLLGEGPLPPPIPFDFAAALASQREREHEQTVTQLRCGHPDAERLLRRSVQDLRSLATDIGHGPFAAAGIPWFATLFGRDALITAYQALLMDPELARGTLRTLAHYQGSQLRPERDEEPGKILHELRRGEMANLGEIPFGRYYGTVDATPLFIMLLHEYIRWTGDLDLARELAPNLRLALAWMETYGDPDGDLFLEYNTDAGSALSVQSWKDGAHSMSRPDGSLPESPVAVVEVQGYAYAALLAGAWLAGRFGDSRAEALLRQRAEALRQRFEERFWLEERGTYCIALDGQKRQVATATSDPGHCLWTGIVSHERAAILARSLLNPPLFSGWGIRTMSAEEPIYSPLDYYNGTVWPHDNGIIALGLARYGYAAEVKRLATSLFQAARYFEEYRLPEVFCGYDAADGPPVQWPSACSPQAWAAGATLMILRALLGLEPDVPAGLVRFRPSLPDWIGRLTLTGLRIGRGQIDLEATGETLIIHRNTTGLKIAIEEARPHGNGSADS